MIGICFLANDRNLLFSGVAAEVGVFPKHRFLTTPDGEEGLNYLCAGYKKFFTHIDPYMKTMADLLSKKTSPAGIMAMIRG